MVGVGQGRNPLALAVLARHEVQVGQVQDPQRSRADGQHRDDGVPQGEGPHLVPGRVPQAGPRGEGGEADGFRGGP